ncbi:sulfotransferase family 2 domain-containing protein [uncultured Roseobacter sp.]|uniref:sulfotransferase family 2 domain-containing protein n=1 Tax=uncultured Roseobacter sp. TaxID=114847 RepID=UPI00261D9663|nr:sulfotransferase family 2 domain-containing protein [uncultured Roseobacter sp.]
MPIVRIGSSLVYYAHVPKCAGTSVEHYLIERFGPLAFLNGDRKTPGPQRWSATSPQHIDVSALQRLFPPDFFETSFAVVRHPVSRMVSAFGFHQARRLIPLRMTFETWLTTYARDRETTPYQFDNHLRRMTEIVPDGAHVFKMEEEGLKAIVPWLDTLAGNDAGPREIPKANKTDDVIWKSRTPWKEWIRSRLQADKPPVNDTTCSLVYSLYKEDYDRFGYDPAGPPKRA